MTPVATKIMPLGLLAMSRRGTLSFEPNAATIPFPAFRDLNFCQAEVENDSMPALKDSVEARKRGGYGLDKLIFRHCDGVNVENLRNFVNILEVID